MDFLKKMFRKIIRNCRKYGNSREWGYPFLSYHPHFFSFAIFRNTLEKQGASISKSVYQLPQLIRLFLDTTKTDVDFNNPSFRSELTQLSDQFPIVGKFYYELYVYN